MKAWSRVEALSIASRRRSITAATAITFLALLFGGVPDARAAYPGTNGRIVFHGGTNTSFDIYTVNPDGTDLRQLTSGLPLDQSPAFSPDGNQIAFVSDRPAPGIFNIYVMRADGTNIRQITFDVTFPTGWWTDHRLEWSPDGETILAARYADASRTNADIFLIDSDGAGVLPLLTLPSNDWGPVFSPDGQTVAYCSAGIEGTPEHGAYGVWKIGVDGSGRARVTDGPGHCELSWSPDGQRIAIGGDGIRIMNQDGSDLQGIAELGRWPVWSPDGTQIAYGAPAGVVCGPSGCSTADEVFVVDADGSNPTRITALTGGARYPSWGALPQLEVVNVDIKPGSDPNSVPCNGSLGTSIPVAILTTDDFDATAVDHSTVEFEGASESHVSSATGELKRHEEDVDDDGDLDLLLHFTYGETALVEAECPSTVEAVLTGQTFDGQEIEGTDTLRLVLAFRGLGCGLGPELAVLLPLLVAARRRRAWWAARA